MTTTTSFPERADRAASDTDRTRGAAPVPPSEMVTRRRWPMIVADVIGAAPVIVPGAFDTFAKTRPSPGSSSWRERS